MDPARLTLLIVAASYVLAATLLWTASARGGNVPWYWPTAWLVTGLLGLLFAWNVSADRSWAWWGCLVVLAPMLAVSLVVDLRLGHWLIAALDVAGLGAIAWALWQLR